MAGPGLKYDGRDVQRRLWARSGSVIINSDVSPAACIMKILQTGRRRGRGFKLATSTSDGPVTTPAVTGAVTRATVTGGVLNAAAVISNRALGSLRLLKATATARGRLVNSGHSA